MHRRGVPALAIKDQLRRSNIKTTVDFYIGSDIGYQREQIEKLIFNSGKIVGKDKEAKDIENAYAWKVNNFKGVMEPTDGFEPPTRWLQISSSTTELRGPCLVQP